MANLDDVGERFDDDCGDQVAAAAVVDAAVQPAGRMESTDKAANRHAAPAVNKAGLYVNSSVRVRPAPQAATAAPS